MAVDTVSRLLDWYGANARSLPWRLPPGSPSRPDPWHVLLSETLLQQTTVAAVVPRYARFLARWPTAAALAASDEAELLAHWAGLGYYARARNLHRAARAIAAGGFPRAEAELRSLPGVGAYTAAAVAAIAFGEPSLPVDANVARVAARLFALVEPMPQARPAIAAALGPLVPADRPGDFAQALMDLGATICTPRAPRCMACPLAPSCAAFALEAPERFPARPPRRLRPLRRATAWWIEAGGAVALVRRPATGLLGGMMALPGTGFGTDPDPDAPPPFPADWRRLPGAVRHGFTHFELELAVAVAETPEPFPRLAGEALRWVPLADLPGLGLPTLYRRAADAVLAWRGPGRAAA